MRDDSARRDVFVGCLAVAAITANQWWIWAGTPWYLAVAFAGSTERLTALSDGDPTVAGRLGGLWVATAGWVVASWLASGALRRLWPRGWRAHGQRHLGRAAPWVPVASGALAVVLAAVASIGLERSGGAVHAGDGFALTMAVVGQLMWTSFFATVALMFFTLYGTFRFRGIGLEPVGPSAVASHEVGDERVAAGAALCVSGGGIRSASFTWGALAELERHRPLRLFDRLYSVSGGGYAATALTSWMGEREEPEFYGGAQLRSSHRDRPVDPSDRFLHVRRRQRYLGNGPGGVLWGALLTFFSILVNLLVISCGTIVIAVPIGLLAGSELGGPEARVDADIWRPGLVAAGLGLSVLVVGAFPFWKHRAPTIRLLGYSIVAAAAVLLVVRGCLPWLATDADVLSASWWTSVVPASLLWLGSVLFAIVRSRLTGAVLRLGGVITVAAAVYSMILVVGETMETDRAWGPVGVPVWLVLALAFLVAVDHTGIQWWSLHPLYRDRLAGTFVMKSEGGTVVEQPRSEWRRWSDVSPEVRPMHVVCAATHRRTRQVTGLQSTSFTFSPEGVRMHEAVRDGETGEVRIDSWHRDAAWFDRAVGGRSSVIASAAISGAAFNPAMGSSSLGSTDSLLALLNLRLGVWLPNPRFDFPRSRTVRPGLRFLFNEVTRYYDLTEPFIHVSDGGHWENLGLVEALRARHRHIVCIDASGDRFHEPSPSGEVIGLGTLFAAADLARIELHAEVRVDPVQFRRMRPDHRTGRCRQNWMTADVVYHTDPAHDWRTCTGCETGRMLFVKAMISDRTPENVLAFANEDRVFPHYPTSDQFLEDAQFRALVGLGESAMRDAWRNAGSEFLRHPGTSGELNGAPGEPDPEADTPTVNSL